ncbi:MAG: WecB/TagA/CpsF family glycosyltransferase, partial [Ignavibacteria bacterium]|nr:WecB/TagA/CpsF family glycosyltransferase [Ignavibacteria bacterium]
WFRNFLNLSQIVYCDGYGVQVGAFLTSQRVNFRFTLPDWINSLCQIAIENNWSIFFLGAKPGISELAAKNLQKTFPDLTIENFHGYFNKEGEENQQVLNLINKSSAQILLVGMGMPLQEKWICDNFQNLSNVKVILPVGALFDYVAEVTPRGPEFLTNHGFEWLTRLIIEPKRLWHRYVIGIPLAFFRILRYYFKFGNDNFEI